MVLIGTVDSEPRQSSTSGKNEYSELYMLIAQENTYFKHSYKKSCLSKEMTSFCLKLWLINHSKWLCFCNLLARGITLKNTRQLIKYFIFYAYSKFVKYNTKPVLKNILKLKFLQNKNKNNIEIIK